MKQRVLFILTLVLAGVIGMAASAYSDDDDDDKDDSLSLSEAARILSAGGKTVGGPGIFHIADGERFVVLETFSFPIDAPGGQCLTVFCKDGTCEALTLAGDGDFLTAKSGETVTTCVGATGSVTDVVCRNGPCSGVWRVDIFY